MNQALISKKMFVMIAIYSLLFFAVVIIVQLFDHRTKIVFCNVGNGDATYIRVNNRIDILIDAGPGPAVRNCLGKYMPFYDRTIEHAFITYQRKSQYEGFHTVLKRYSINNFYVSSNYSNIRSINLLFEELKKRKTIISSPHAGDTIYLADASITIEWPKILPDEDNRPRKDSSYTLTFAEDKLRVLFVGSLNPQTLQELIGQSNIPWTVIKVSEYGFDKGLNTILKPLADSVLILTKAGLNEVEGERTNTSTIKSGFNELKNKEDLIITR